ncbi:phosphatase PAP2 family protein [Bacillus canaveralius]|uniref:phosphatase PAP2 family protein n=1 Tax=Bacillus canaveralius TaxID=1403243 RepID=UPI000F7A7AFC|nr:phosphatase PAP2 family protein [Bacillus canaveralius]RSK53973.1 phosphatase PAP2 family protein [Bacillus canaveralius]
MKKKYQLITPSILAIISLTAFSFMAFSISSSKLIRFDNIVIAYIQGFESLYLTSVMKFFTLIGSAPVIVVLSLIFLFLIRKFLDGRSELTLYIAVTAGSAVLNQLLKLIFQRARPDLHRLIEIGGYSFPSGHAMNAMSVYGISTFLLLRHIPSKSGRRILIMFSVFMICIIGISRIYLGVHYPSDIIGGYLAGGLWLGFTIWLFQRLKGKMVNADGG